MLVRWVWGGEVKKVIWGGWVERIRLSPKAKPSLLATCLEAEEVIIFLEIGWYDYDSELRRN